MKFIFGCFASILCLTSVHADENTLFGIELGKPISINECKFKTYNISPGRKFYDGLTNETCFKFPNFGDSSSDEDRRNREIWFKNSETPVMLIYPFLNAIEDNGNLVGFHFFTAGVNNQSDVMVALKEKYGNPSSIEKTNVKNFSGASFESINAVWKVGKVTVVFNGTTEKLDVGEVFVDLPEAVLLRNSWKQKVIDQARKM